MKRRAFIKELTGPVFINSSHSSGIMAGFMGLTDVHCDAHSIRSPVGSSLDIRSSLDIHGIRPSFFNSITDTTESYARAMGEVDTERSTTVTSPPFHRDMASAIEEDLCIDIIDDMPNHFDQLELSPPQPLLVASPVFATPWPTATLGNAPHVGFEASAVRVRG